MSQKTFIRQERRKLLLQKALLESEQYRFSASKDPDWFCQSSFVQPNERRIVVQVGGKIFEISTRTARKDPRSLLAAFATEDSPLQSKDMGCFRVDRDWWIFRYVLNFLRDGILPQDSKTLKALYQECDFWRLESLKRAIEERHLRMYRHHSKSTNQKQSKATTSEWWQRQPDWWGSKTPKLVSTRATESMASDQWWTGKKYNGVDFTRKNEPRKKTKSRIRDTESTWTVAEAERKATPSWYRPVNESSNYSNIMSKSYGPQSYNN